MEVKFVVLGVFCKVGFAIIGFSGGASGRTARHRRRRVAVGGGGAAASIRAAGVSCRRRRWWWVGGGRCAASIRAAGVSCCRRRWWVVGHISGGGGGACGVCTRSVAAALVCAWGEWVGGVGVNNKELGGFLESVRWAEENLLSSF